MAVRWRDRAIDDLLHIDSWLSSLEHGDPETVRRKIHETIGKLERLGDIGRPWRKGSRAISVRNAPYVIVFRIVGDDIDILSVLHQARIRRS